jgi:glyoxylase-like metal-dependent hydrolase (beta-lactamase superfamily II)
MFLGDYRVEVIPDTEFKLDGGAMFGVVPRVVWERVCAPDEKNRIRMNMNCLFVETPKEKILIETGIGEKWNEKQIEMYGILRERPLAETLFERTGCAVSDITIVVNTHLHFDHAGGNTIWRDTEARGRVDAAKLSAESAPMDTSKPVPQFPYARYFVSRSEFEHANNPHERDRASYLKENWQPLVETGQLELKDDDYEVVEGLTMQTVRGHSETMQTVKLRRAGKTLYGFADLIPMRHHLPLPWIAGFDLFPTETLAFKKEILPLAMKENWICLFYHDVDQPLRRLMEVGERIHTVSIKN